MSFIPFRLISSDIVHEGFLKLQIDTLENKDNVSHLYHVLLTGKDAVAIIAKDKDDQYILNFEYRHPTKKQIWGCPGGQLDEGEEPVAAAKRELLEESGYLAKEWLHIGTSHPFPAVCEQKVHYILARDAKKVQSPKKEPFEHIVTKVMTKKDLLRKIFSTDKVDGILCAALFYEENWARNNI